MKYAESFGAVGMKVKEKDDLSQLLRRAFLVKKPVLIECPIDYSINFEAFSGELEQIVCDC
jgi:acetolactate synthase-1/2/3 large subunit